MAKSDDDAYLVCLRVGTSDLIVPGSMRKTCSVCSHRVWVSPASWEMCRKKKLPILCMQCAEERAATDDDARIQAPTPEQLKELRDTLRKDFIERG